MWSFFKLQAKVRFKSPELIFPIIFPLVLTLLFGSYFESDSEVTRAYGALIALSIMQGGLFGMGFTLIDTKESVLMKRVGATSITKRGILIGLMMVTLIVMLITLLWQTILFAIFSGTGIFNNYDMQWGQIAWGGFIFGIIIGAALSLSIGMFFAVVSKDQNTFSTYAFLYFFGAAFLGGMMVPNSGIPWTRYVGYVFPSSWNANLIMGASLGGDVFNFANGYGSTVIVGADSVQGWEAAYNCFMPILFIPFMFYIDNKLFKID
ncbi:MAG: hypothetical protein HPAVJP_1120 [Candidatus Hepatoplasma vulgare]|nr:MAG: hypothetical protein HPAVJP_1120 [Candidatus Hepatoplasma sp.]